MLDTILFLSAPITASVLLAGMLGYFGNHILSRGIIFIDIALAQIAALGTMVGLWLGTMYPAFEEGTLSVELISMIFTLLIIALFALTKFEKQRVPQEAIIGIIYGLGLGLAMFFAEHIPRGSNYITKTITGNILWVTWKDIALCLVIFVLIGLVHLIYGKYFIQISDSKNNLPFSLRKTRMLELLFYLTFAVVIVRAVPIGGIFLIFALLIAPTAIATLFTQKWRSRFIWSWIIGTIGSVAGIYVSYTLDISNGPAIVCLLGISVFILAFGMVIFKKRKPVTQSVN
ncbi:metal ABC transporter permease [candidate division KSB1 bacterium]